MNSVIFWFEDKDDNVVQINGMKVFSNLRSANANVQAEFKHDKRNTRIDATFDKEKASRWYSKWTYINGTGSLSKDYDIAVDAVKKGSLDDSKFYVVTDTDFIFMKNDNGNIKTFDNLTDLFMYTLGVKLMSLDLAKDNLQRVTLKDWT
jgi:hypothetical protein